MSKPLKLLISCRDPGSAGHLAVVAKAALSASDIAVQLCAARPALDSLIRQGLTVDHPLPASRQPDELFAQADQVLANARPDVLLTGISGPDAGIDEALLARAGPIPTLAYQDYWGYVNPSFEQSADCYLVQDEMAASLTPAKAVRIVGAPKYATYDALDPVALSRRYRETLGLNDNDILIGFCGQPLWQEPGYLRTLQALVAAREKLPAHHLLFRSHPKEGDELKQFFGDTAQADAAGNLEQFLSACDLLLSPFSNCGLDLAYLNRRGGRLGAPAYLMFDDGLRRQYQDWNGLSELPSAKLGVALQITEADNLAAKLQDALATDIRRQLAENARSRLPDPNISADKILDAVHAYT